VYYIQYNMLNSQAAYLQMVSNYGPHETHNEFVEGCNECYHQTKDINRMYLHEVINPELPVSLLDLKHILKIHKESRDDLEERNKRWAAIMPTILNPLNESKELKEPEEDAIHEEWIENKCDEYNKYHY